jgi:site-specific recombinase XerD
MKKGYQTLSNLFWLNKQRAKNQKPAIYLRLCWDYKRIELATHLYIDAQLWNAESQRARGNSEEALSINERLTIIKADLHKHYNRLQALNKPISAEILKNVYLGIGEKPRTLREALEFYINRFSEKVKTGKKAVNTLKSLNTTKDKALAFVKVRFRTSDIALADIKNSFPSDLEHFLTTVQRLSSNTSMKYIKILKQVLKTAVGQGWTNSNPFAGFTCPYQEPKRERLIMEEIMILYKKDLHIARLEEVRDVFLFCCFTGYAYQDVFNLSQGNIELGIDGEKWIAKDRQKTNNPERIPLLPIALEIVERYKNHPYCVQYNRLLPVDSNQRYNGYLKEIAVLCGIKKHLTTHTARHTFATTVTLENDVPIETISQMLGHKSIRTTQIYAKITQRKISNNMQALKKRLFDNEQGIMQANS